MKRLYTVRLTSDDWTSEVQLELTPNQRLLLLDEVRVPGVGRMSDQRRDYGAAGCAEGCATRGTQLLILAGLLAALLRRKR